MAQDDAGIIAAIRREQLKGATDEYLKRPLWDFAPEVRPFVLSERAKRWGVPEADRDFDPEYH
jgi:hypothetical protein